MSDIVKLEEAFGRSLDADGWRVLKLWLVLLIDPIPRHYRNIHQSYAYDLIWPIDSSYFTLGHGARQMSSGTNKADEEKKYGKKP